MEPAWKNIGSMLGGKKFKNGLQMNKDIYFNFLFHIHGLKILTRKDFLKNIKNEFYSGKINPKKIYGIILETFQGWGTIFYPKSFIHEIKKFSKKNNIFNCI